jgi:hypothetical protein
VWIKVRLMSCLAYCADTARAATGRLKTSTYALEGSIRMAPMPPSQATLVGNTRGRSLPIVNRGVGMGMSRWSRPVEKHQILPLAASHLDDRGERARLIVNKSIRANMAGSQLGDHLGRSSGYQVVANAKPAV